MAHVEYRQLPGIALPAARRSAPLINPNSIRAKAPLAFPYVAALMDAVAIFAAALACDRLPGFSSESDFASGSLAALALPITMLVLVARAQRGNYAWDSGLTSYRALRHVLLIWNFVFLAAIAFLSVMDASRAYTAAQLGLLYAFGLPSLVLTNRAVVDLARMLRDAGLAPVRRVIIVGAEDKILRTLNDFNSVRDGVEVVSIIAMRDHQAYEAEDLALAAAAVRMYRPDDVYLAVPWAQSALLERCADAFMGTPAQVHVGMEELSGLLREVDVSRFGGAPSLRLTRPPVSMIQRIEKRVFDIAFASAALLALSPLLLAVALLIRLESRGPALFRQTRYGFNQEPFRIFKFRSMRTMEDGANVKMVTKNDPRVTRLGAFLRRSSIDELPQLLNVLSGEMSIVGPRPHALSHDQRYVERLSRYARRHNVKPGITGWAQVHGFRGEIRNDQDMQLRLEHDLYYVDNCSLALDIKTILLTLFSRKTRQNAY